MGTILVPRFILLPRLFLVRKFFLVTRMNLVTRFILVTRLSWRRSWQLIVTSQKQTNGRNRVGRKAKDEFVLNPTAYTSIAVLLQ